MTHILLVEDDLHIANGLVFNLELEGYQLTHANHGDLARKLLFEENRLFDLIILDVMLPGISGFDICHALRRKKNYTPILFLTAKNFEKDKIKGLRLGADDYLTKPFNLEELLTRVQVLLRRESWHHQVESESHLQFGQAEIDFDSFEVKVQGEIVHLTPLELKLLKVFSEHEGIVLSREYLLEKVWNQPDVGNTRSVDNFVMRLRKFFEESPTHPLYFHSIRGVGYKFTRDENRPL